jgi:hypothetical protein
MVPSPRHDEVLCPGRCQLLSSDGTVVVVRLPPSRLEPEQPHSRSQRATDHTEPDVTLADIV